MRFPAPSVMLLVVLAATAAADEPVFRVAGRSLATVSVNAGRSQGLRVGDQLRVVARDVTVAEMEVVQVGEHTARCRVRSVKRPVGIGDLVVVVPRGTQEAGESRAPAVTTDGRRPAGRGRPRGRTEEAASAAGTAGRVTTDHTPAATLNRPTPVDPSSATTAPGGFAALRTALPSTDADLLPVVDPPPLAQPATVADAVPAAEPVHAAEPVTTEGPQRPTVPPPAADTRQTANAVTNGRGFRVKYRSAANVYLDGGRAAGLAVGDRLRVVESETTVARLEVMYVAELSASCTLLSEERTVRAGDKVVLEIGAADRPPERVADASASADLDGEVPRAGFVTVQSGVTLEPPAPPSALPWAHLHGAVSFGYSRTWDATESALDFEQRTGRLDLSVREIAGRPLSFTLRARSREDVRARSLSARTPQSERTSLLYEAALRYEPIRARFAFELGRLATYRFAGIGYLDGALGRVLVRPSLQLGAFGGRYVEGPTLEGIGRKYGAFVRLAPGGGRYIAVDYDVLLAYVRESAEGDLSREYLSFESRLGGASRFSLFQRAELDLNRGWRRDLTGSSHSLSNVSLSGNLRLTPSAWAFVSYDGRRNYRYYRNRLVPEEVFDDLLHQGLRAGVHLVRPGGFGASAGFGMSLKEEDPRHPELNIANAYSFNLGLRHANLFSSGLFVGIDGSGFTNGYTDGGLGTARLGWTFGAGHMLDLSYGYSLYRVVESGEDRVTQWLRLLGRAELWRRFYVLGDLEYDAGDDLQGPRGFLELGVLF